MELDERGEVLRVGEAAAARAGAEARRGLAGNPPEQDVLVLAVPGASGPGPRKKITS